MATQNFTKANISDNLYVHNVNIPTSQYNTSDIISSSSYVITNVVEDQKNVFLLDVRSNTVNIILPQISKTNSTISISDFYGNSREYNIIITSNENNTIMGYNSLVINNNNNCYQLLSDYSTLKWIIC